DGGGVNGQLCPPERVLNTPQEPRRAKDSWSAPPILGGKVRWLSVPVNVAVPVAAIKTPVPPVTVRFADTPATVPSGFQEAVPLATLPNSLPTRRRFWYTSSFQVPETRLFVTFGPGAGGV